MKKDLVLRKPPICFCLENCQQKTSLRNLRQFLHGVVIGISDQFHIPVRYIGIGEGIDQLRIFDRKEFVNALFGHEKN